MNSFRATSVVPPQPILTSIGGARSRLEPVDVVELVLVQGEMERGRFVLGTWSALRAGIFKAWGGCHCDEARRKRGGKGAQSHEPPRSRFIVATSPQGCPLARSGSGLSPQPGPAPKKGRDSDRAHKNHLTPGENSTVRKWGIFS